MSHINEVRHHAVRVPATSANLGPGFDAFGIALRRHLIVTSGPRGQADWRVMTAGEGADELPTGDDNLIWRSLVDGCRRWNVDVPDVALKVINHIPPERGLGSSSSAIVAGLAMARALTRAAVTDQDVVHAATEIEGHPDNVAPAMLGGLVACAADDDGEIVIRRVNPAPALRFLACVPAHRQATNAARAVLAKQVTRADVVTQASRAGHVLGAFAGWWSADASLAGDRLHEPPRLAVMPETATLLGNLRSRGIHAWLSGAGPSIAAAVSNLATVEMVEAEAGAAGFVTSEWGVDLSGTIACPDGGCAIAAGGTCVQCPRNAV
ncbi:MAG: homoserine kinase [Nitriliruptoraceae bacterium]